MKSWLYMNSGLEIHSREIGLSWWEQSEKLSAWEEIYVGWEVLSRNRLQKNGSAQEKRWVETECNVTFRIVTRTRFQGGTWEFVAVITYEQYNGQTAFWYL